MKRSRGFINPFPNSWVHFWLLNYIFIVLFFRSQQYKSHYVVIHKCLRVIFILEKLVQVLLEFSEGNCWVLTDVLFPRCCVYLVSRNWETIFILPFLMISGASSPRFSSVIHMFRSFSFCQSENEITFLLWFAFLWILLGIYFLMAIAYACHRKLPAVGGYP